jgi:hypothetical protein
MGWSIDDYDLFKVRKQRVQTFIRCGLPSFTTVADWMFGAHCRLVRTIEWLTLCPNDGLLPQISHFAMIAPLLHR